MNEVYYFLLISSVRITTKILVETVIKQNLKVKLRQNFSVKFNIESEIILHNDKTRPAKIYTGYFYHFMNKI